MPERVGLIKVKSAGIGGREWRRLDPEHVIVLLCGRADYRVAPRSPKPTSGLVEQQRWFMKAARGA
jgi:hypothetical protein